MCHREAEKYMVEALYSVIAGERLSLNTKYCW